ncbi:MAG: serine/threonine protein kinase [Planctomycetaceae bacterium]
MPMTVTSVANFLTVLSDSQLLSAKSLRQIDQQVRIAPADLPLERLVQSLLKVGLLTRYQAQRLLCGYSDGFFVGEYKLQDVLGQGGMGTVYLAEQTTQERLVALKVITNLTNGPPETRIRFEREARAATLLSHPNIVQAYDCGESDGVLYISLEYVEGFNAAEQFERFGRLPWRQAADYMRQAALGLEHARLHHLVHRDIKPANLLIATDGTVKVLDLGLCLMTDDADDRHRTRDLQVGTVDYMAPEQALDCHAVDTRADIYSLGCVFYALLSGHLPFEAKNSAQKLLMHQTAHARPVHQHRHDLPTPISDIIHTMLEKNPDDRFQTPGIVAEALKPWAERVVPPFPLEAIERRRKQVSGR